MTSVAHIIEKKNQDESAYGSEEESDASHETSTRRNEFTNFFTQKIPTPCSEESEDFSSSGVLIEDTVLIKHSLQGWHVHKDIPKFFSRPVFLELDKYRNI